MNTTPKTPLAILADAADELHALADRLTDAAEELLPEPQPPAVVLPTVEEVAAIIRDGGFYADTARAILDLIASRMPVPAEPEDPRVELLAQELEASGCCSEPWPCSESYRWYRDARLILARLDAVRADA